MLRRERFRTIRTHIRCRTAKAAFPHRGEHIIYKDYYEILTKFIAINVCGNNWPYRRPQHRRRQDHEKLYFHLIATCGVSPPPRRCN